ncbi:MAG: HAD family hydrolase [Anaerolineae bacterium]|nr:HAD family hydrolase [Anaerolineae bacterium]
MPIKAITFDFWSTLYQSKTVDYAKRLLTLKESVERGSGSKVAPEQFEAAVKLARETWSRTWAQEHRTMTADEWLGVMLQDLRLTLELEILAEIRLNMEHSILADAPTLAPEVSSVLPDLASRYRLAIISDTGITPGRVLRQLLEHDHLTQYFTHLTFSDEIGRSKPHPSAFLTTLAALGAAPTEAVHIGDLLRTDIAGAQAVGMRAVQYIGINHDQANGLEDGRKITPDAVIQSHIELEPLLQRWNEFGTS